MKVSLHPMFPKLILQLLYASTFLVLTGCKPVVTKSEPVLSETTDPNSTPSPNTDSNHQSGSPFPPSHGGSGPPGGGDGGGSGTGPHNVTVSWNPNHEKAVNSVHGGYRVYYSTQTGFSPATGNVIQVPYVSGHSAPDSVVIPALTQGTYYIKVIAYSAINPTGTASDQLTVGVP